MRETLQEIAPERRDSNRQRALKGAQIIFNNRSSAVDCTIRNISQAGARLVFHTSLLLPERFDLRFSDGQEHHCVVRWRKPTECGVEFCR